MIQALKRKMLGGSEKSQAKKPEITQEQRKTLQENLIAFTRATYHRYQAARVHRYLASKLEAVAKGTCKRLIVTFPPRHGKSELTSVRFPAWFLGRRPEWFIILACYGAELAFGYGAQVKDIVDSPAYRQVFPGVELSQTRHKKNLWRIKGHGGGLTCAGVGGPITGFGAHCLIIDDPIKNDEEGNSANAREKLKQWYQATAYTRLEGDGAIIVIQTRWNQEDLAGTLMAAMDSGDGEEWEVVDLPAIAEEDEDWGAFGVRAKGEALWPEKFSVTDLERIKKAVGAYWWASLYQGRPRPLKGKLLDPDGLMLIDAAKVPPLVMQCRFWDLAFSEKDGTKKTAAQKGGSGSSGGADYCAGALCGIDALGRFYILHIKRSRGEWPKHFRTICDVAASDDPRVEVIIEANGTQLGYYQQVRDALRNRTVKKGIPDGNKVMRAGLWGSRLEDGIIYMVKGNDWQGDFTNEMREFPNGAHDDQVDGVSGGWRRLSNRNVSGSE